MEPGKRVCIRVYENANAMHGDWGLTGGRGLARPSRGHLDERCELHMVLSFVNTNVMYFADYEWGVCVLPTRRTPNSIRTPNAPELKGCAQETQIYDVDLFG